MMQWPIGIFVDNFHLEIREAIRLAAEIGAESVQFAAKDPLGRIPSVRRNSAGS